MGGRHIVAEQLRSDDPLGEHPIGGRSRRGGDNFSDDRDDTRDRAGGRQSSNARLYEAMAGRGDELPAPAIQRALRVLRGHLRMDVAYLARFLGETWTLRDWDSDIPDIDLAPGQSLPRGETICGNVADGALPGVIPNTAAIPLARRLKATSLLRIGAHLAAPVRVDGAAAPWGMLCCFSIRPDPSLNARDLSLVEAFAEIVGTELGRERDAADRTRESRERVAAVLEEEAAMVAFLQPIWELTRGIPWGAEALCRFVGDPGRGPDAWFAEAGTVSLRAELELAAVEKALGALAALDPTLVLSLNVSPATVRTPRFGALLAAVPSHRLLVEFTERLPVEDYDGLRAALAPFRGAGLRIAVDDAGGGYASMTHILQLQPDIIKADMSLTRAIDTDRAKQALLGALASFAHASRATLLAEGIETAAELAELRALGVSLGQGYLLGRPAPPGDIDTAFASGAAAFRPALVRGLDAYAEPSTTDYAELIGVRRRFAAATDPSLVPWVV